MTYRQFYAGIGAEAIGFVTPNDGFGEVPVVPLSAVVRCFGGRGIHGYYFAPAVRLKEAELEIVGAEMVFIHGLFTHPGVWAAKCCQRHGVPYVIVLHGILDPWALLKSRLAKKVWMGLFGSGMLRNASAVVCATQREADKASPFLGHTPSTRVISWACSTPGIEGIGAGREELRRNLGLNERDRVLVYLGRLHSMKRPIETVRIVAESGKENLKLLVIGPDEDVTRKQLEATAKEMGWPGLRAVGPVFGPEKFDYLRAADGFISLSHRENFNYGLAEAMAVGLPPILSQGNDLGWEFSQAGFSWQLSTDEKTEAALAIEEFRTISDVQLRQRGYAAREWTGTQLGETRLKEKLEDLGHAVTKKSGER